MRTVSILVTLSLILVLVSGCWDLQEITELAPINGLGIDPGERPGTIKVSVQLSLPSQASPGTGGGASGGPQLRVITLEAPSLLEAINLLFAHTRREPFLRHLGYIVFGEEMAKAGIAGVIGGLQGAVTIRGSVPTFVAVGSAEGVLKARSGIGRDPGQDIVDLLTNIGAASLGRVVRLNDVINTLGGLQGELSLPIIETTDLRLQAGDAVPYSGVDQEGVRLQEVLITRTAIFDRDRWVHDLDVYLSHTLTLLTGVSAGGSVTIVNPADPSGLMALQIDQFSPSFDCRSTGEDVELTVKIRVGARLVEVRGGYDFRVRGFDPIKEQVSKVLGQQVSELFAVFQDHNTDALGIGGTIHRKDPKAWSRLEPVWDEVFPQIKVAVQVESEIIGTSLQAKPFEMKGK